MAALESLLLVIHLLGLGLALGSATTKLTLLLKSKADPGFIHAFAAAARPITRVIITGTLLLVASGIGWLLIGYPLSNVLVVKIALVASVIVLGVIIDNIVEPKFLKLAPDPGQSPSPEFTLARNRYLVVETAATGLFYIIVVMWVLAR